jgi:hypothetical protein
MKSINWTFRESQSGLTFESDLNEDVGRQGDLSDLRGLIATQPTAVAAS